MPDRLHWNTVKPILKEVLTILMQEKLFDPFRLVGGTSLSLQLGHRMSDDIDLFSDEPYDSLDFTTIDKFLRKTFKYASDGTVLLEWVCRTWLVSRRMRVLNSTCFTRTRSFSHH